MMKKIKIGIIGLGYVGLPLAVEFGKKYPVIGFDINVDRVKELKLFNDSTLEVENSLLKEVCVNEINILNNHDGLFITKDKDELLDCNFYIITVPTPVDGSKRPVLKPLIKASETVASLIKKGDYIIYESTVYPGATEEVCLPILEKISKLRLNKDIYLGYSPERINPGDKKHTVTKIKKVTSGSSKKAAEFIDLVYSSIITAGTYSASSIKVAEAAKVIENSQRDINIAFVNELSKIFSLMNIDTTEVLKAASTKWNFLNFKPGLVGGHCIGVDPYYLAQKALSLNYNPEIILSGRRINDSMGTFVADKVIKLLIDKNYRIKNSNILILGITFKENCPDIRNTGVISLIKRLNEFGVKTDIYDPWANPIEVKYEYDLDILTEIENKKKYDSIVLAVAHDNFKLMDFDNLINDNGFIYDIKAVLEFSKNVYRL